MSFFVPSVHVGRTRPVDPEDPTTWGLPFGATRRRPKRKKPPIPWTCKIPYMCRILLVTFSGFGVLLGGVAMSIMGYYPGYFAQETAFNGTSVIIVQNNALFYHIRNFSFIGPILMGIGCFAMITAGVIYFEFRDKYFLDLPQSDMKSMTQKEIRNLLVDQFRRNYFRGIPIPVMPPEENDKPENDVVIQTVEKFPLTPGEVSVRKGSSVSMGNSMAPMFTMAFPSMQRAHSTSTIPSVRPSVILSPLNLIHGDNYNSPCSVPELKDTLWERGSLANMFKLTPSSLSGRTSNSGVENPAYLSDDSSTGSLEAELLLRELVSESLDVKPKSSCSPSPDGQFNPVIVHAASIHFPPDHTSVTGTTTLQKSKSLLTSSVTADSKSPDLPNYVNKSCPLLKIQGNSRINQTDGISKKHHYTDEKQSRGEKAKSKRVNTKALLEGTCIVEHRALSEGVNPVEVQSLPARDTLVEDKLVPQGTKCVENKPLPEETKCVKNKSLSEETKFVENKPLSGETKCVENKPLPEETKCVENKSLSEETKFVENKPLSGETKCVEDKPLPEVTKCEKDKPVDFISGSRVIQTTDVTDESYKVKSRKNDSNRICKISKSTGGQDVNTDHKTAMHGKRTENVGQVQRGDTKTRSTEIRRAGDSGKEAGSLKRSSYPDGYEIPGTVCYSASD